MKKQFLNILYFVIFICIWVWLLFYLNSKNNISKELYYHNWIDISQILNQKNYDKAWIDPNKYQTFSWFLNDFKSFTWVEIDPVNENFSIWIKNEDWTTSYVPFDFIKNKDNFEDIINKNLAILDIFQAYKNWEIYWWNNSKSWKKLIFESERKNIQTFDLNRVLSKEINVNSLISDLEKYKLNNSRKELLNYLYDFTWNYKKANENRLLLCSEWKDCKKITLNIAWTILDQNSKPISWAKIELLNDNKYSSISKQDWTFDFNLEYFPFSHLRFKATIPWYSDWYNTYILNEDKYNILSKPLTIDFTLNKASKSISINSQSVSKYKKNKYYIIEDEYSKYSVPTDWLYYFDWTKYEKEDFDVYLYFFKKTDNVENLLNNDTFTPVSWYVWNLMKTFWMPYIQFVDKSSKKELFVKSSNPIILQNQIYHMKELYENFDWIYTPITKEDMQYLVKISKEKWWYPIDFEFLTKNNFLRWPAWWTLDRKTWIWWNVWMKVLDENWLVELPFYSIKDN